ncbi:hypothetical protein LZ31DRAFT_187436, partial [Colletotrichum somersetense]
LRRPPQFPFLASLCQSQTSQQKQVHPDALLPHNHSPIVKRLLGPPPIQSPSLFFSHTNLPPKSSSHTIRTLAIPHIVAYAHSTCEYHPPISPNPISTATTCASLDFFIFNAAAILGSSPRFAIT